jgi:hypothetical protein
MEKDTGSLLIAQPPVKIQCHDKIRCSKHPQTVRLSKMVRVLVINQQPIAPLTRQCGSKVLADLKPLQRGDRFLEDNPFSTD